MNSLAFRLARPEIRDLPPFDIAAQANGVFAADAIKLDANENPFVPLADGALTDGLNRYPQPQPAALRASLAALYGVPAEGLLITRGADDGIDLLVRTFCRAGADSITICPPTFAAYAHFALLQGARVRPVPLDENFDLQPERLVETVKEAGDVKLCFVCAPNNPTGNLVEPAQLLDLCDRLDNTILVVDEAYIEFSDQESLAAEAVRRPNLVVLRTLSKAYGLAGARVGAVIAHSDLIEMVGRALPPYPLPTLSIQAASLALAPSRRPVHQQRIAALKEAREELAARLSEAKEVRKVRTGGGNFVFIEVEDADGLAARLHAAGIRVRFRPNAAPGGVRVSVGTEAENDALLAALGVETRKRSVRRGEVVRDTKETSISVAVDLDRASPRKIDTGVAFFDHMLDQVAAHGGFSLILACQGDLHIDAHHTVEDCAIAFGQALDLALGDRRGIGRFGFSLPMDEAQAQVLIDLGGRAYSRFEGSFESESIGAYPTEMTPHVFRSIAEALRANVHVSVNGENDHHKTEACFKAFGRALRQAVNRAGDGQAVPSTKGVL